MRRLQAIGAAGAVDDVARGVDLDTGRSSAITMAYRFSGRLNPSP
jgi:hypothetical protein